jgi:uncharacterized protein YndB with AHSA1/START domain
VIERPVKDVFRAFEDPEVIAAWQDNLLEFEQLEGSFDKTGGVARMKVKQVGMTNDLTVTVLDRDARRHTVKYHYEGAQAPFTIANTFKAVGDGSTEWTAVLDAKIPLLAKALELALKPLASNLVRSNGEHFRAWCEAEL